MNLNEFDNLDDLLTQDDIIGAARKLNDNAPDLDGVIIIGRNKKGEFGVDFAGFSFPELFGFLEMAKILIAKSQDIEAGNKE